MDVRTEFRYFLASQVNNTTGAHTLTLKEYPIVGAGIVLAQTKTAIVRINSASTLQQVTAAF